MIMTFWLNFFFEVKEKYENRVDSTFRHTINTYCTQICTIFIIIDSYILGLKNKQTSLPVWRGVQKVKGDISFSTAGTKYSPPCMRGSSSCPPTQPIGVHQGCSVQANHSRRRSSIQWLQQNGAPFSGWENLSHSCYGKCSLAVIPLVTGHGSPASLLDRRRGEGAGSPSGCQFIMTKGLFTLNRTGLNA